MSTPKPSEEIVFQYDLEDIHLEMAVFAEFIRRGCCTEHDSYALAKMNFLIEAEQILEGDDGSQEI